MEVRSKIIPNPFSQLFWAKVPDLKDPLIISSGLTDLLPVEITNDQKRREWLGSRYLLKKAGIQVEEIILEGKKPVVSSGHFFSLSHTSDWVAANVSTKASIGIDIEKLSPRILKIKDRFTHESEWKWIAHSESIEDLVLIWSAKEALFKKFGGETAFFNSNLIIRNISRDDQRINASVILKSGEFEQTLEYIPIEDHFLVYTL